MSKLKLTKTPEPYTCKKTGLIKQEGYPDLDPDNPQLKLILWARKNPIPYHHKKATWFKSGSMGVGRCYMRIPSKFEGLVSRIVVYGLFGIAGYFWYLLLFNR